MGSFLRSSTSHVRVSEVQTRACEQIGRCDLKTVSQATEIYEYEYGVQIVHFLTSVFKGPFLIRPSDVGRSERENFGICVTGDEGK